MRLSLNQIQLMTHALGSEKSEKWYRNHFVAGSGSSDYPELCALEKENLMARAKTPAFCDPKDIVFQVTAKGKEELKEHYR